MAGSPSDSPRAELRLRALARNLRQLRKERGWSRRLLAERAGQSERFLADVEKGLANPSLLRLLELGDALDEPLEILLALGPEDAFAGPTGDRRDHFLALLGLRGAGKSSLGPMLATRLGRDFVELDEAIEQDTGLEIGEIFELHGETWFRRREREVLQGLFDAGRPLVLACGGGLVTDAESFALLRHHAVTLWLEARPEDHWNRVVAQGDTRPMRDDPRAFDHLCAILAERRRYYAQADLRLDTHERSLSEVFGAAVGLIRSE